MIKVLFFLTAPAVGERIEDSEVNRASSDDSLSAYDRRFKAELKAIGSTDGLPVIYGSIRS